MDFASELKNAYERFLAGDLDRLAALLADTVTYHLPGRHLGGGVLRGKQAVFRRTAEAVRACDELPRIRVLTVIGAGQFVVTVERFSARRGDRFIDQEVCVVWRIDGDRCVELWAHFSDQAACDAFWEGSGVEAAG